jgi:hypothetical protein
MALVAALTWDLFGGRWQPVSQRRLALALRLALAGLALSAASGQQLLTFFLAPALNALR